MRFRKHIVLQRETQMWEDGVKADVWSMVSLCDTVRPWGAPAWSDKKGCQWTKQTAITNSGRITPFVPSSIKNSFHFSDYTVHIILYLLYTFTHRIILFWGRMKLEICRMSNFYCKFDRIIDLSCFGKSKNLAVYVIKRSN